MIQASYKYPDGSEYKGEWNAEGQRHGIGKKKEINKNGMWCF